jgi:hypothetical protein
MKAYLFSLLLLFTATGVAVAQYVPKDKRKSNADSVANKTKPTTDTVKRANNTTPTKPEKPKPEPLEHKFIGYAIAFPTFMPNSFTINGGTGSFNVGYRVAEQFNVGITTSFGYQTYNNVTFNNSGAGNASLRNTGIGLFAQFNINENYFLWGEYANLYAKFTFKDNLNQQTTTQRSQYAQPLFGGGAKYEFGSGNHGIATMLLFNPKYGDPFSPYPSALVTRILYYFHF